MNVNGKILLFTEGHTINQGKKDEKSFLTFTTTISHKNEDDTYINASVEVRFVGDMYEKGQKLAPDSAYTLNVEEGWLDVRTYQDKEGKLKKVIFVNISKAKTEGKPKKLNKVENPF